MVCTLSLGAAVITITLGLATPVITQQTTLANPEANNQARACTADQLTGGQGQLPGILRGVSRPGRQRAWTSRTSAEGTSRGSHDHREASQREVLDGRCRKQDPSVLICRRTAARRCRSGVPCSGRFHETRTSRRCASRISSATCSQSRRSSCDRDASPSCIGG